MGDVISLTEGQQVPADCLLLHSYQIILDESSIDETRKAVDKNGLTDNNDDFNQNPFLLQGTFIKRGFGTAIVCAVGGNTYIGKKINKLTFDTPTPTQKKL